MMAPGAATGAASRAGKSAADAMPGGAAIAEEQGPRVGPTGPHRLWLGAGSALLVWLLAGVCGLLGTWLVHSGPVMPRPEMGEQGPVHPLFPVGFLGPAVGVALASALAGAVAGWLGHGRGLLAPLLCGAGAWWLWYASVPYTDEPVMLWLRLFPLMLAWPVCWRLGFSLVRGGGEGLSEA